MSFSRVSTQVLGIGSVAFGVWGLLHPRSLAAMANDKPRIARWLGARDMAIGAALLKTGGPKALALRMAADTADAIRLRSRSPKVALGALGFAALAVAAMAMGEREAGA